MMGIPTSKVPVKRIVSDKSGGIESDENINTFLGSEGSPNATGSGNVTLGNNAGQSLTVGNSNVLIGEDAGKALAGSGDGNLVGALNVFIGADAGGNTTTGYSNVAIGQKALNTATESSANVVIGKSAGAAWASDSAVVIGNGAGEFGGGEDQTVYVGALSGGIEQGQKTTALGYGTGRNSSGSENTFVGYNVAASLGTGSNNTWIGSQAGVTKSGASSNVLIGIRAGQGGADNIAGSVIVGAYAGYSGSGDGQNIILGYNALVPDGTRRAFVAGSNAAVSGHDTSILDVYFGSGIVDSAPDDYTIHGTGGEGTDIAGGDVTIAGGISTGSGTPGRVKIAIASASSSGSSANTLADIVVVDDSGLTVSGVISGDASGLTNLPSGTGGIQSVSSRTLLSNVTTNGTISDLTFTGLTIGNRYQVVLCAQIYPQSDNCGINIIHDGSTIGGLWGFDFAGHEGRHIHGPVLFFNATATTLTFEAASLSGTSYIDSANSLTKAQLIDYGSAS